jgi:hypothetical protein
MTTDGRMRLSPRLSLALRVMAAICASFSFYNITLAAPPAGHADLSGVWQADMPFDFVDPAKDEIPLTPAYAKKLKDWRAAADSGRPVADSVARCEAFGMPRIMSFGLMELLQTPGRVTMITEIMHEVRRIYTDGRKAPADYDSTYDGFSVGHWENGALLVHTTGLIANTLDQYGIPHSDQLVIDERLELVSPDRLRDRITLIDPLAYTKHWTVDRFYNRAPKGTEIGEYICNTNGAALK